MIVRQLSGRLAGQLIDMPHVVAQNSVTNGTAALPDSPITIRFPGVADDPDLLRRAMAEVEARGGDPDNVPLPVAAAPEPAVDDAEDEPPEAGPEPARTTRSRRRGNTARDDD